MNPQEEALRISPGDVLAYATEASFPKVEDYQVPDFLDINYRKFPIIGCDLY